MLYLTVLIFLMGVFAVEETSNLKLCGIPPVKYDTKYQECNHSRVRNKTIAREPTTKLPKSRKRCGFPPVEYDTEYQECKHSVVRNKTTPQPTSTEPSRPRSTENPKNPKSDRLECLLSVRWGRTLGHACCGGFATYLPEFDTCCMRHAKDAQVHKGKPEKKYACCTGRNDDLKKIYLRGSKEIPCLHPSLNDKFWRTPKSMKKMKGFCDTYKYAYVIRIHNKINVTRTGLSTCYNATLKRWSENQPVYTKCIPIDKYSPRRILNNNNFAVLTDHDYERDLDFYLDKNPKFSDNEDLVFKGYKNVKKFNRKFKKLRRKCRKESQGKNVRKSAKNYIGKLA